MKKMTLPINEVLPELCLKLRSETNVVLIAEPGAGKTTRVPIALLDQPWLRNNKIIMLEPRRLAARSSARFMAQSLGESLGQTIGYRVKGDTKVGPQTRIEVVTEGVLTRMLQADPALEGVGTVIFDEFHERNLSADLGLALCLQSQALFRDDLRIIVMSATLDEERVVDMLGGAPVIRSSGRTYPIETHYLERRKDERIEDATVRAVTEALQQEEGDLLVFLPGTGEIRRVEERLKAKQLGSAVRIAPLYGNLSPEAQDAAIRPVTRHGERKIVLATNIAESSLTVEGVRVVIDSGLERVSRFSPRTGMTRLETAPISSASADQRRGRAGRLGPGVCFRLWTEAEHQRLAPYGVPELLEADLAPLALELAAWGSADPAELQWLDAPPAAAYAQARGLLAALGALDAGGAITAHGRAMAELGVHPRLAHMILQAVPLGLGGLACELAALLGERDVFRGESAADADVRLRLEALRRLESGGTLGFQADEAACRRILADAKQWKREMNVPLDERADVGFAGLLLAFAYPDRIAQGRGDGRFLLQNGRGAALISHQALSTSAYLTAAELDDTGLNSRILLASPLDEEELEKHFASNIEKEEPVYWERSTQSVHARLKVKLGAITIRERQLQNPDPDAVQTALLDGIRQEGLRILPWSKSSEQLRERIGFMHRYHSSWPDVSDDHLLETLRDWLGPHIFGMKSRSDLQKLSLTSILEANLSWAERNELEKEVPTHWIVPSGSKIPIDYSDPERPVLAVRLQELFGLAETPRIAGGRAALTLQLLSPAHRPVQVTQDLASFWKDTYFEVKKDLKGRYPKHYWPDNPLEAIATNRAKPRS